MILGFVAAATGDWFMAGPGRSFAGGVAAFSAAQLLWLLANARERTFDGRLAIGVAFPLAALFAWRIGPAVAGPKFALMIAYSLVSVAALAVASGTRRVWYLAGIGLLFVSDVCIALRMAHIPHWGYGVGPLYVGALVCLVRSTALDGRERRLPVAVRWSRTPVIVGALAILGLFLAAMAAAPEHYNPCMRMLSRLGRTKLGGVSYPLCHYLFTFGLLASAATVRGVLGGWGGLLVAAGLLTIAAVPENVSMVGHNAGCHLAALGGIVAVLSRTRGRFGRSAVVVQLLVLSVFGLCLLLHELKAMPFAPAVPTLQKALIVSFGLWVFSLGFFRREHR